MRKRNIDYGDELKKLLTEFLKIYRQPYLRSPYAVKGGGVRPKH